MSPLSTLQWKKVAKALVYSFASGFVATLSLLSLDFIHAAQQGIASIVNLGTALIVAAAIGGINAVIVYIKQLFTEPEL